MWRAREYGGSVRAPDGTVWTLASSPEKTNTTEATGRVAQVVLLLGVSDVRTTKAFYDGAGLAIGRSFGSQYVEFDTPGIAVTLGVTRSTRGPVGRRDRAERSLRRRGDYPR
ncbi:hypothetical protein [Pseudonocardia sp. NPDC046786]|uniref:hypothetical protein n=1 Tax=Pseudonocardia sp. NPDC046786 TaxID=3155471 RepID=UPI0033F43CE4